MKKSKEKLVKRELFEKILPWLKEKEIIAINGARQVGKTTLLLELKKLLKKEKVVYLNFEEINTLESFSRSPKDFVALQLSSSAKTYFLFDEFQYVREAGKILKILYDSYPSAKFIITGSSSLKIRQIASFLVGRVVFFNLYPFSFSEYLSFENKLLFKLWKKKHQIFLDFLEQKRNKIKPQPLIFEPELYRALGNYVLWGGYPAIATSKEDFKKARLNALIETYIEKDIIKYLQIGNFLEFKNLAKILALQLGNLVVYSSLSQDAKLAYREIKKFLGVLEKTFVIKLLPPYFSNKITEIRKSPKVYFLDLGLRNILISDFRAVGERQDKGAIIENFVFQNLFFRDETAKLSFWRTKQGAEVDFVLEKDREMIPLEVKFQDFKIPRLSRSFLSFIESYQPEKGIVLNKNFTGLLKYKKTQVLFFPFYFL